jgi:hypothetical protein
MFRYVQLKIGRVDLGEPLAPAVAEAAGIQLGAREADLPVGSFGRAERIKLHLSGFGTVVRIEFAYPPSADFEKMISDYVSLGAPTRQAEQRGDTAIDVARWGDSETELTLTRELDASGSRIRGELRDRTATPGVG